MKTQDAHAIDLICKFVGCQFIVVAYNRRDESLVYPLIDYAIHLSDMEMLSAKTVSNELQFLKRFLEFLLERKLSIPQSSDELLAQFRDIELLRVLGKANRSDNERAAKRTVNAKLRRVYQFLFWFQDVERKCERLIGSKACNVLSTIDKEIIRGNRIFRVADRYKYPLLFRSTGARSRHGIKYVATENNVEGLARHFMGGSESIARRNILILELANETGMRRGSINSLRLEQFLRDDIDSSKADFPVVPDQQKFGYENRFEIPFRLAYRICDYIDEVVTPTMRERGWTPQRTEGRIFFSFRDGRPLRDQSLSQIFGKAMDATGVNKHGANLHSLRRKFANDEIVREIDRRVEFGLDTSDASIAASVSITLGQSNPMSIAPYVSGAKAIVKRRDNSLHSNRIVDLESEIETLRNEIARLKRKNGGGTP